MQAPIPSGWLSVADAAKFAGIPEAEVRRRAKKISPEIAYTSMGVTLDYLQKLQRTSGVLGLPDGKPESLPLFLGSELKLLHNGRIILRAELLESWKRVEDH